PESFLTVCCFLDLFIAPPLKCPDSKALLSSIVPRSGAAQRFEYDPQIQVDRSGSNILSIQSREALGVAHIDTLYLGKAGYPGSDFQNAELCPSVYQFLLRWQAGPRAN